VRRDLPWSQRTVQAAHAATNLAFRIRGLDAKSWGEHGPNLVVYGVAGERELLDIERSLAEGAVPFREPDLGNHLTAVAYLGPSLPRFDELTLL
jgi:hypothetical protein